MAPGELAVAGPRVAEGVYHGPLTLVRGGWEEDGGSWGPEPPRVQTPPLCSPKLRGARWGGGGVGGGGDTVRGRRSAADDPEGRGAAPPGLEPHGWTRLPRWRGLQGPHATARPLIRLACTRPPPPDARRARPSGAAGNTRWAEVFEAADRCLPLRHGSRAVQSGRGSVRRGGRAPVTSTRAPHLTGAHVVPQQLWVFSGREQRVADTPKAALGPFQGGLDTDRPRRFLPSTRRRTRHKLQGHQADKNVSVDGFATRVLSVWPEAQSCWYLRL